MALLLLAISVSQAEAQADTASDETLILFLQHDPSPLAAAFEAETLPEIQTLADELGVTLLQRRVSRQGSAPVGVNITPLIVFQNHRGRSIYQGRYTTLDRVRNFVRTSRFLPQGDEPLVREDVPVWEVGGTRDAGGAMVATPIKITAFATAGGGYLRTAASDLDRRIREAIDAAEDRFTYRSRVELGRSDRMFYIDFYPYLDAEGQVGPGTKLYLGMAVFSQFHCHEPIWTLDGSALTGTWGEAPSVFADGFKLAAEEIARQLGESPLGDGFDTVPATVARVSWDAAGLTLPAPPAHASAQDLADAELVRDWVMDQDVQAERPAVQFAFPPPLDGYAGQALDVTGEFSLGVDNSLPEAGGTFRADPASVTMGESDLDAAIHGSMLEVDTHPDSSFVIESIDSVESAPAFGQVTPAVLHGRFTMKGQSLPLSVPVSIEAYLHRSGEPRLSIDGRWTLRLLEPFGIDGPPGDTPTNDTLIFRCHLVFKPA